MQDTGIELGLCPFCGGKARISCRESKFYGHYDNGDKIIDETYQVICNKCHARGPIYVARKVNKYTSVFRDADKMAAKEMAMHAWNITQYRGTDCDEKM